MSKPKKAAVRKRKLGDDSDPGQLRLFARPTPNPVDELPEFADLGDGGDLWVTCVAAAPRAALLPPSAAWTPDQTVLRKRRVRRELQRLWIRPSLLRCANACPGCACGRRWRPPCRTHM